jgi:hypothetical protein
MEEIACFDKVRIIGNTIVFNSDIKCWTEKPDEYYSANIADGVLILYKVIGGLKCLELVTRIFEIRQDPIY